MKFAFFFAVLFSLMSNVFATEADKGRLVQSVVTNKSYFTYETTKKHGIVKSVETEHPYFVGHQVFVKDNICTRYNYEVVNTIRKTSKAVNVDVPDAVEAVQLIPVIQEQPTIVSCDQYI